MNFKQKTILDLKGNIHFKIESIVTFCFVWSQQKFHPVSQIHIDFTVHVTYSGVCPIIIHNRIILQRIVSLDAMVIFTIWRYRPATIFIYTRTLNLFFANLLTRTTELSLWKFATLICNDALYSTPLNKDLEWMGGK